MNWIAIGSGKPLAGELAAGCEAVAAGGTAALALGGSFESHPSPPAATAMATIVSQDKPAFFIGRS